MSDSPDSVMLFAAGFGTRMGALTRDRPKPLVEVAGRALIDHALDLARGIAPRRIVANTHYRAEMVQAHLRDTAVSVVTETPRILDTGGGLRNALPLLGPGPVFTLNTDAIWSGPNPLALLRDAWRPGTAEALLLCVAPERAIGHRGKGDFIAEPDGAVRRGPGLIYCGAQILLPDGLNEISEEAFSLNLLWDRMLADGRLRVLEYPGRWCDVGSPEGVARAEALLAGADV